MKLVSKRPLDKTIQSFHLSFNLSVDERSLTLEQSIDGWRQHVHRHTLGNGPVHRDIIHGRLESKPERLHHLTEERGWYIHTLNILCSLCPVCFHIKSYFGLHAVSACDELSVTRTFSGHSCDESRTRTLTDPEGETPADTRAAPVLSA